MKFVNGRKCHALVRNKDGKFHVGGTQANFTSNGKMYTAGLTQALQWFSHGLSRFAGGHEIGDGSHTYGTRPRDMSEYTVVEYTAIEVERTPADEWMKAHGKKQKQRK